jgi:hypothetical protein
MFFKTP